MEIITKEQFDRILRFFSEQLGVPVFDLAAPATMEAMVELIDSMSPEVKKALVYGGANRFLGSLLASGPQGMGNYLMKLLQWIGLSETAAIETAGKWVDSLDRAIQKRKPKN